MSMKHNRGYLAENETKTHLNSNQGEDAHIEMTCKCTIPICADSFTSRVHLSPLYKLFLLLLRKHFISKTFHLTNCSMITYIILEEVQTQINHDKEYNHQKWR